MHSLSQSVRNTGASSPWDRKHDANHDGHAEHDNNTHDDVAMRSSVDVCAEEAWGSDDVVAMGLHIDVEVQQRFGLLGAGGMKRECVMCVVFT